MTTVSIVSGVAARIENLIEEPRPSHISSILSELNTVNKSLKVAAHLETKLSTEFGELEKEIVQLCYSIDDVIEAAELGIPTKPKGKFPIKLTSSSSEEDLVPLKNKLVNLKNNLDNIIKETPPVQTGRQAKPESPTASMEEEERAHNTLPAAQTSRHKESPKEEDSERPVHPVAEKVIEALLAEDSSVVCIQGESGMGKTSLAIDVFYNRRIRGPFDAFAWVSVDKECRTKKLLQDILVRLRPDKRTDIGGMNEIQLSQEIFTFQEQKKCLFLLDDIAAADDWRSISLALMIGNSSKIIIATPSREVAEIAEKSGGRVFSMPALTEADCFKILKEKAFFNDAELQDVGTKIFSLSKGSPFFTETLGKCLMAVDPEARHQVVDELHKYRIQISQGEKQVLELCYHILPDELKPCLLYMGQFPEGQEIEVEKLHLLLAAEDLTSSEDVGNILKKLACINLVLAQENKMSMTGRYKSCQLHEQVRKFCTSRGPAEKFFEVVDFTNKSESSEHPEKTKKLAISTHRLAIYLSKDKDRRESISFSSQDGVNKIRSLLIFDTHESQQNSIWPSDLKEFVGLRVLDFDGVNFRVREFPRGMDKLVFVRYLSFRGCCLESFPSSISKFLLLETLDLRVRVHADRKMTIPADIFSKMKRLRHLYFPTLYASDGESKLQLCCLEKLKILVNFDTGACDVNDLYHEHLKNLQILTAISEGSDKDLEGVVKYLYKRGANLHQSSLDVRNFDICHSAERVRILKDLLKCETIQSLHIEGQIRQLPEDVVISEKLTEIIFDGSELGNELMNVLEKLQNLRSLELLNDAFVGNEMTFGASKSNKFCNLRRLKLWNLRYLEELTFKNGATMELSTLVIENCDRLKEVLMSGALYHRLEIAQARKGDDFCSVEPAITHSQKKKSGS